MRRISLLAVVCALVAVSPGTANAQAAGAGSLQPSPPAVNAASLQQDAPFTARVTNTSQPIARDAAPVLVGSDRLGVSQLAPSDAAATRQPVAAASMAIRHRGPGVALMIVGAAGIITGLLLEESLITVLGAGAGLIGLYLYVR